MDTAFPGAICAAPANRLAEIAALCVTDPQRKDAHVTATAAAASADTVVTDNVRDFPPWLLARYGLRRMTPDTFCAELFTQQADLVIAAARNHRSSLRRKTYASTEYLDLLATKAGLSVTTGLLAAHIDRV